MQKLYQKPDQIISISHSSDSDLQKQDKQDRFSNISSIHQYEFEHNKKKSISNINNSMDESFDEPGQSYRPPKKKRNSFLDRMITNGVVNMLNRKKDVPTIMKSQIIKPEPKYKKHVMSLQFDKLHLSKDSKASTTISPKQIEGLSLSVRIPKIYSNVKNKNVKFKEINTTISPITERVSCSSKPNSFRNSPAIIHFNKVSPLTLSPEEPDRDQCYSNRPSSSYRSRFQLQNLMGQNLPDIKQLLSRINIKSPQKPQKMNREFFLKNVNKIMRDNQKFIDDEFPPNISALCIQPTDQLNYRFQMFNSWETACNLVHENLSISRVRDPSSFEQGLLKDWGLISVLAAIANEPTIIMRIFEDQQINSNGVYYVRICKDGIWQYVILDDYFPYDFTKKDFFFVRQKANNCAQINDFWVALLEKAFSKVYGTYQDLEMSMTPLTQFLRDLTSAPVEKFEINTFYGDIEELIIEGENQKYIMMVSNENCDEKQQFCRQHGIPPNYSYQVLSIQEERVVLKNPFGWIEKPICSLQKDQELGLFFIHIQKLNLFFKTFIICQFEKDNFYSARHTRHLHNSYSILEFEKKRYGLCTFESHQPDMRLFRAYKQTNISNSNNYEYAVGRLILCSQEGDKTPRFYNDIVKPRWNYVTGASNKDKIISIEADLYPGIYRLIIIYDWVSEKKVFDVNVSAYADDEIQLDRINVSQCPNLIAEVMITETRAHGKKYKYKHLNEYVYASESEKLLTIVIENHSDKLVTYKKDFSFLDQSKLQLITILSDNLEKSAPKLKRMDARLLREQKTNLVCEFKLYQIETKALVFKIIDKNLVYDSKVLRNLGFK